ncbi:unnamed protein product [Mytilus edulis]|uniref:G-protein coupled receptors family 1 profile domain-containing protein n=1 Tax=Mytilus edulis TaxID=6550 RepID=A0A8S3V0L7_MYTED|nr:unnamed protein product [Mytilus edulis]
MNVTLAVMETILLNETVVHSQFTNQSDDHTNMVSIICENYIGPTLCVFGIVGNILNLIILYKGALNDSPYLYLKALALTDMLALLLSFIHLTVSRKSNLYGWKFFDAYFFFPIVNSLTASSVWLTVGMSIDRLLYVKAPLWARAQFSLKKAKGRIILIFISTFLMTIPGFLCYSLVYTEGQHRINPTEFRSSTNYRIYDIACIVFFHVLPLVIFTLTNTYLICAVQRARVIRKEYDIRNNKEKEWQIDQRRFTITLISIVMMSIIAILPSTIGDFTRLLHISQSHYQTLRQISNILLLCNLSMNFILFCAFNKRFVRGMKSVFGGSYTKVKFSIRRTKSFGLSKTETNVF